VVLGDLWTHPAEAFSLTGFDAVEDGGNADSSRECCVIMSASKDWHLIGTRPKRLGKVARSISAIAVAQAARRHSPRSAEQV
jgi:hypothetical protein